MAANELSETSPFGGTVDATVVVDTSAAGRDGGTVVSIDATTVSLGMLDSLVVDVSIGEAPFSRSAQAENTNCAVINMAATRRVDVTINETLQNLVCNRR